MMGGGGPAELEGKGVGPLGVKAMPRGCPGTEVVPSGTTLPVAKRSILGQGRVVRALVVVRHPQVLAAVEGQILRAVERRTAAADIEGGSASALDAVAVDADRVLVACSLRTASWTGSSARR